MKLLFDQNLSYKLCERRADLFPDSNQVRRAGLDTADDRAIWEYAKANGYVIASHDADFADMTGLYGPPPKVVWLRCGNQSTGYIEKLLRGHVEAFRSFEADADAACWELY